MSHRIIITQINTFQKLRKLTEQNGCLKKLWIILLSAMTIFVLLFIPGVSNVYAYRLFVSTDAASDWELTAGITFSF